MKIWYQSATAIGRDPNTTEYEAALRSYLNEIARPNTEVSVHGVELSSPYIGTSRCEAILHEYQFIDALLQAQQKNYDAFSVGCMLDPCFHALREIADICVSSLAESSMFLACLLAPNFSLLSYDKILLLRVIELVKLYGLQDRFIECSSFGVNTTNILPEGLKNPEIILEPAGEIAKEAARKGVCMLVNCDGILNMIMAKHNVQQIEGIPVLQGAAALIKMTEMLVDLKRQGIDRSKLGMYTPLPKEDLESLLKLYNIG